MTRRICIGAPIIFTLALSCCSLDTNIDNSAILASVSDLVSIHDAYVVVDVDIDAAVKSDALSESYELKCYIQNNATTPRQLFLMLLKPVAARYEHYVWTDETLTDLQRRVRLRTSDLLKSLAYEI